MSRIAYFDCFAGASGDMILGALVAAGAPLARLRESLGSLPLDGYELQESVEVRQGLAATRIRVIVSDVSYKSRSLADVEEIIERSGLDNALKRRAVAVFSRLAEAEGRVHGQPAEAVHFHDVGAIDAIVDVVGAVCGLSLLGVTESYCSPLPLGNGTVATSHGLLPVPAPATLALLQAAAAPTCADPAGASGELTTPTAAAILTTLCRFERPALNVLSMGSGAGERDPESHPNILRVIVGETTATTSPRRMLLIETNIDDMPAEQLAHALQETLAAGAVDAWFTPIQMKKGRPAVLLSALCSEDREQFVVGAIFKETTTLGLRVHAVYRHEAERESFRFNSSMGEVGVKVRRLPDQQPLFAPEFEDCRRLAVESGMALRSVMELVGREAAEAWLRNNGSANNVTETAD